MKHKRLLLLFSLLVIASLALAACGGAPAEEEEEAPVEAEEEAVEEEPVEEEEMECVAESDATRVEVCPGESIRLGESVALTGPIPDPGADIDHGANVAVLEINEAGGVLGFELELDVQDGACDGDAGTNVGNLFAADPTIVAVSGGTCSGETFGLTPILQEARIPFVSPSATNPDITSADCDVCNRVALSDALQGAVDAEYVYNTLGLTKVAVMHDGSDYGLGLAQIFNDEMVALGAEVTTMEGVQVGDTDFRPVLTLIASGAPELIFFGGYSTEAGLIAAQMGETGLGDAAFFSDDGAYAQQYLDAAGAAAEGTYLSFVAGDEVADANAAFDARYQEEFGVAPDDLGPFHAQAYDTIVVIADAIERAGTVDDSGKLTIVREDLIAAIRATSGLQGLTGSISCNEIGECGAGGIQIFQVTDGEFVQLSGFGL